MEYWKFCQAKQFFFKIFTNFNQNESLQTPKKKKGAICVQGEKV